MALSRQEIEPYTSQLNNLSEDAGYSAQSYFEAAKAAEFWGRAIVFVPALLGAVAAIIVALGGTREWGAVGAVAGAVAATASFLGQIENLAHSKIPLDSSQHCVIGPQWNLSWPRARLAKASWTKP